MQGNVFNVLDMFAQMYADACKLGEAAALGARSRDRVGLRIARRPERGGTGAARVEAGRDMHAGMKKGRQSCDCRPLETGHRPDFAPFTCSDSPVRAGLPGRRR